MFDRELLGGSSLDLKVSDIVQNTISHARYLRSQETTLRVKRDRAVRDCDFVAYRAYSDEMVAYRRYRHEAMRALVSAIGNRTRQERQMALEDVRMGRTSFAAVSCAGEECGDCDRPMYQHIRIAHIIMLCPFGRQYWTYARAIFEGMNDGELSDDARDAMADIARASSRHAAPTWPVVADLPF